MKNDKIAIRVATSNSRGFLKNLFDYQFDDINFIYEDKTVYEIPGKMRLFLAEMIKWRIFDFLGIFQCIKVDSSGCDALFSYNRFLKTDKPYYIFLENPSALVNYCWNRPKHFIARRRLKKYFGDNNLKGIICMSKACYSFFPNLYGEAEGVKRLQIYPLIEDDMSYGRGDIAKKANNNTLECLFISSDFELKGGRDIIEVFKKLNEQKLDVHINIITRESTIRTEDLRIINSLDNMDLIEFRLNKRELSEYYKKSAILLNPTRMDSFSLVTLEAIKYGCAIMATDVYAIREMDQDGYNGYMKKSMFKIWNEDGSRNRLDERHPERTVLSGKIDLELAKWMGVKICDLYNNRELLETMCANSLELARNGEFSERSIIQAWKKLILEDAIK